jgi:hypothetical protein
MWEGVKGMENAIDWRFTWAALTRHSAMLWIQYLATTGVVGFWIANGRWRLWRGGLVRYRTRRVRPVPTR